MLLITNGHSATATAVDLQHRLITQELTTAYKFLPDPSSEAYAMAEKELKSGHFTFSDEEIDAFLPTELRKTKEPANRNNS